MAKEPLIPSLVERIRRRKFLITTVGALAISAGGLGAFVLPRLHTYTATKTTPQSDPQKAPDVQNLVIPNNLRVPPGHTLLFQAYGKGVQIYACPVNAATAPTPHAILSRDARDLDHLVAIHYAGPTWEALDGSKVVGEKLVSTPSPDPKSVPWLLLQASSHAGTGLLSQVTFIQRLSTQGGVAPANCSNQEVSAEYSALYLFYVAASS